jgi:alcohol sulfotransferase
MNNAFHEELRKREVKGKLRAVVFSTVRVVSFPRSGRTWIQKMTQCIAMKCGDGKYRQLVMFKHDGSRIKDIRGMRKYSSDKLSYCKKRVVLVVRDPRDVAVSHYFMLRNRMGTREFRSVSVDDFVTGDSGLHFCVKFLNDWTNQHKVPKDFLAIYYEDFLKNPVGELRKLCEWCGLKNFPDSEYEFAVEACSFDRLQKWDREVASKVLRNKIDVSDGNSLAIRRGKSGGFVDFLKPETIQWANKYIQDNLDPFYRRDSWPELNTSSTVGSSTPSLIINPSSGDGST